MVEKMRLGRLIIDLDYVVNLDDKDMVEVAKDCFCRDLLDMFDHNEVHSEIDIREDPKLTEEDIPGFLKESWLDGN